MSPYEIVVLLMGFIVGMLFGVLLVLCLFRLIVGLLLDDYLDRVLPKEGDET